MKTGNPNRYTAPKYYHPLPLVLIPSKPATSLDELIESGAEVI